MSTTIPDYCSVDFYTYRYTVTTNTQVWSWQKGTKMPKLQTIGVAIGTNYSAPEGAIVDVIREIDPVTGNIQTALIIYDSSVNSGNAADYPKYYLRKVIVTGSNGSNKMVLLKVESANSPDFLRFYCFNFVSEEVEVFDYPAPPCINDFSYPTFLVLKSKCTGFTRTQYYHDGNGGITTIDTANSPQCGYVAPTIQSTVTKEQRVEIKGACSNPVFVKWKNTLGGWDQWVFEKRQILSEEIVSRGTIRRSVFDIEQTSNPVSELGKASQPKMILGAEGLTNQQKDGLMHLLKSNRVMILNTDNTTFREVMITPGSFTNRDTGADSHSIEFEVIEPEINTIGN